MIYTTLDSDEKIFQAVKRWESFPSIAVDFEGEFNLHIYGEHLCLIQIYDTEGYWIIDPRSPQVTRRGLEAFFSMKTEKIWFDVQSDASLVYKVYGLRIENVYDVRVPALALGYTGNLLGLVKEYLGLDIEINKKKNQQANWLKRPIDVELMEYALLDVKYLHRLKEVLVPIVVKECLSGEVEKAMAKALATKEPQPGWKHICQWKKMSREEKAYIRHIFIARDKIARSFNVPAARVMDKHKIIALAKNPPRSREEVKRALASEPQRFRGLLEEKVNGALLDARKELSEG